MGCYINPESETKEEFLNREGARVPQLNWATKPEGTLPVVLIDNGFFTAAGVAYSENELDAFTRPDDYRPHKFYYVPKEKLYIVSDLKSYLTQ